MDYKKPTLLIFKWTVSRGRDTYGYNICSLYADGEKVASCNGGGYDMRGTALGKYLTESFRDRFLAIADRAKRTLYTGSDKVTKNDDGLYGFSIIADEKGNPVKAHIDGACGQTSVEKIAAAAGITLTSTKVGKKEFGYFLTI